MTELPSSTEDGFRSRLSLLNSGTRKILILGDSITHGGEGDYTWRYRLWEWCKEEGLLDLVHGTDDQHVQQSAQREPQTYVSFVGPYTGVKGRDPPIPTHPAPLPGEDDPTQRPAERITWGYAKDVDTSFAGGCRHFATWGYQAFQCKDAIAEVIEDWQPDLVLSLLGFNDVGWWVSDADGTLESIKAIIDNTRAVKPNVDFAFGNIVNRTFMEGRDDLLENTRRFNELLPVRAKAWSKKGSRVVAVDVASHYDCGPQYRDWAPAAYDGLHPSALGEFQIAKAFSEALLRDYNMGRKPLVIPSDVPERHLEAPDGILARSTPMGIRVIWKDVYGADYQIRHRASGQEDWTSDQCHQPSSDIDTAKNTTIELQIRSCHGFEHGPWSDTITVTCTHPPLPSPTNVKTRPTASGFAVSWSPPSLSESQRYEILYKDSDRGDMFPTIQASPGGSTSASIKHLHNNHVIDLILVRAWTYSERDNAGWSSSPWSSGRAIRVGDHPAPKRPLDLRIESIKGNIVNLAWDRSGDKSAAGYLVYCRDVSKEGQERGVRAETNGQVVRETRFGVGVMGFVWNYEFSVSAVNGEWESERSAGVIPERP